MSLRQAPRRTRAARVAASSLNFDHSHGSEAVEKAPRLRDIEQGIRGLETEEESVLGRALEAGSGEERVIRRGKPIEREHPEDGRESSSQDRDLEGDRDECRPAVERAPAHVERVVEEREIELEAVAGDSSGDSPPEDDPGEERRAMTESFGQTLHREGRERVHPAIALSARAVRGLEQALRFGELREKAVEMAIGHGASPGLDSETSSRISNMEIMGRKRMKR
jgi:hypothetical protein